ncbi:MAG: hypothetical protein ABI180_06230 [Microcoleus sp.]
MPNFKTRFFNKTGLVRSLLISGLIIRDRIDGQKPGFNQNTRA